MTRTRAPAEIANAPGTRQPRGRARRAAVLDAARRLFASQGFKGSSLAAIAQEAGITDAGLLYHFPAKDELSNALCDRLVALGATRVQRFEAEPYVGDWFIVMQDPEGNEFCLD